MPEWIIWTPQLDLQNELESSAHTNEGFTSSHTVLQNDGSATYEVDYQLAAFCGMDLGRWPFDYHTCQFDFEASINQDNMFTTRFIQGSEFEEDFITAQWKLVSLTFGRDPRKENDFRAVALKLIIERRTRGYAMTLFAPVTVIIVLTLCGFWLPVQAGEKILLNGIVGVLVNIYMLYFADKLPNMGINTPLVVKFCSFTLYLTMCSMIISIVVLAISRTKHAYGTPWAVKRWLEGPCGQFLLLKSFFSSGSGDSRDAAVNFDVRIGGDFQADDEEDGDQEDQLEEEAEERQRSSNAQNASKLRTSMQQDWILLATAIDRIAFLVYSLIFIVIAIVYHV